MTTQAIDLYQQTGGKLRYQLHRGQAQAWRSEARFTFIIAGTQGGKTSFLPLWLDREIKQRGQGDYLAATATYDLFKLKFLPEMRQYFVTWQDWQEGKSDRVFWRRDNPGEKFTRIILRSASSEAGLESATVKGAVLDECGQDGFRVTAWEAVLRRLAINQGRVLGGTTPYNLGWLKSQVYDLWLSGDPDYRVIQFKSIDNPSFPRAEYDRARRTLAAWKFEMFYNGQFSRPAGLIYSDFDDTANKVDDFIIPGWWPRYVGVDFGGVHMATVWGAYDPESTILYIYRESLEGNLTIKEHSERWSGYTDFTRVVKWTGGAGSEDQWRRDFTAAGVPLGKPNIAEVEGGIDRTIALIKTRRLRVFKSCKMLLDQVGTYSRKVDESGQPTEEIKDKDTFHLVDALRYNVIGFGSGSAELPDQPKKPSKWTSPGDEDTGSKWRRY
jgi:hypothetical protein